jgi:sodium pump decarboxylase gamma subunit
MNVTLLAGSPQITQDSSIIERLTLGGSTLLLGMIIVFMVLSIIFIALQIMRAVFTKNTAKTKQAKKAEQAPQIAVTKDPAPMETPVVEASVDEGAVVAAIIAAISAHTGKSPEGFRVVSFKKRK